MMLRRAGQVLAFLFLVSPWVCGQEAAAPDRFRADVTRFGAVPDDGQDDTDAIERAVAWAQDRTRRRQMRPRGSSAVGWQPAIFFPTGRYRLSRQIHLSGMASLYADPGKAVIEWVDDPNGPADRKGSMFLFSCYTNTVKNLKFVGGETQLQFQNANTNQTLVDIEGCEFQHARGIAVRAIPSGDADHLSTLLTIRNCKFMRNFQCLETYCDITKVEDTWVEFSAPFCAMDEAVFVNRSGKLIFDNMVGVPGVCKDTEAMKAGHTLRWVDNYANFYATFSRFGGEGAGMPAVFHFAEYRDTYPFYGGGTISITHSSVNVGSMRDDACVVRLYAVPTQVTIRDCKMVNAPIFRVDPSLDIAAWKTAIPEARRQFRYVLEPNYTYPRDLHDTIPEPLKEFVQSPEGKAGDQKPEAQDVPYADVTHFGARGDGEQDDGPAITAAVAHIRAAARRAKIHSTQLRAEPELFFPPGMYKLSSPVDIAGVALVRGTNAVIIQTAADQPAFTSRSAYQMVVSGLSFSGGRTHLELWNRNTNMGHIVLRDCRFNDSTGPAVNLLSGAQSTDLLIESCMFRHCEQALVTHTDITMLRDSWIQTASTMRNKAVIEHRGQKLFLDNITGVPLVNGQDQRWIDCHGSTLAAYRCRFGGEGGGFTPVVNWHPGAAISILDSTISSEGNAERRTVVYCEAMATLLTIRGCSMRVPPLMLSPSIDLQTCFLNDALEEPCFDVMTNRMPDFELPAGMRDPVVGPLPVDNLPTDETKSRMAAILARETEIARDTPPAPLPDDAVPITLSNHTWDLEDTMDTLVIRNSEYLAVAEAPTGIVIMRRAAGRWPHVLIRDVEVDLDKRPVLSWITPDRGDSIDGHSYAVKIVDHRNGKTSTLQRRQVAGDRHSHDLRSILGRDTGTVRIDIKFYYLGYGPHNDPDTGEVVDKRAEKGEYMVLEKLFLAPPERE